MFNIFKKKKSLSCLPSGQDWHSITLNQFLKIRDKDMNDPAEQIEAMEALLGMDCDDMKISEFTTILNNKLSFLTQPIPEVIIKEHYTLNSTRYDCNPDITSFTVSQYMDFTEYAKRKDFEGMLTVVLIPHGCSYNEGYEMESAKRDILTMSIVDAYAVSNFFFIQFKACIKTIQDFSVDQMKKEDRRLAEILAKIYADTESSLMLDQ